ncbi:MAG: hypothetical protein K2X35_19520 [Bryobacteraceae bacterium]|nr:hypothetical protein [Bryobacteraceae bacterium]
MKRKASSVVFAIPLLLTTSAFADNYFPLAHGNRWIYRDARGASHTISVGLPLAVRDGRTYFRVTGYTAQPAWLRINDNEVLMFDEETSQDILVTRFGGREYPTSASGCDQTAIPQERKVETGQFRAALEIGYRHLVCADAGFESELYAANVGLVQRTETTIAGPRTWSLVSARVGNLTYEPGPYTSLNLTLERALIERDAPFDPVRLRATLRFSSWPPREFRFQYPSSQRFDVVLRNETGATVYQWSANRGFLTVIGVEQFVGERSWAIDDEIPSIPDGKYTVEVWLTTIPDRLLANIATVEIKSK